MIANRHHREDRAHDEAREDAVAAAALKAAAQVVESNEEIARVTKESAAITQSKVDVVHTLVNSEKTAGLQRELDGKRSEQAMLAELAALTGKPSQTAIERAAVAGAKIEELEADLAERSRQQEIADAQIAKR